MRAIAAVVSAGGGRFIPDKPTLVRSASGQFTISNYNSNYQYVVSANSGTATRSGNTVTMSGTNAVCTVTAYPPKGVIASIQSAFERRAYTSTSTAVWNDTTPAPYAANIGPGAQGAVCPWGGSHNGGGLCVFPSSGYTTYTNTRDATPSGFTDHSTEWCKVS